MLGDRPYNAREQAKLQLFLEELAHVSSWLNLAPRPSPLDALPPRLQELAQHLVAGLALKQAASVMGVSFRTAEGYAKEIHRRLGVHSRSEISLKVLGQPSD